MKVSDRFKVWENDADSLQKSISSVIEESSDFAMIAKWFLTFEGFSTNLVAIDSEHTGFRLNPFNFWNFVVDLHYALIEESLPITFVGIYVNDKLYGTVVSFSAEDDLDDVSSRFAKKMEDLGNHEDYFEVREIQDIKTFIDLSNEVYNNHSGDPDYAECMFI